MLITHYLINPLSCKFLEKSSFGNIMAGFQTTENVAIRSFTYTFGRLQFVSHFFIRSTRLKGQF